MLLILAAGSLSACGEEPQEEVVQIDPEVAYLENLTSGTYYIRHTNPETGYYETIDLAYSDASVASEDGTLWFKEDFYNTIPTFTSGDSIIYYTEDVFDENFSYERYEDMGYTIGLRGMSVSPSGRYDISTNPDSMCTYPGGDTDAILELGPNETVKLDTLGEQPIRDKGGYYDESDANSNSESYLTRVGTIRGLEQGKEYSAQIYKGTVEHDFNFVCDVRVFASMDSDSTIEYVFESEKIINIEIPSYFKSGYYMINGVGLFRYMADNETFQEGVTNMNIANVRPSLEGDQDEITINDIQKVTHPDSVEYNTGSPGEIRTVTLNETGNYLLEVTAYTPNGVDESTLPLMRVCIVHPDGTQHFVQEQTKGYYTQLISASQPGDYYIYIYDLSGREVNFNLSRQSD